MHSTLKQSYLIDNGSCIFNKTEPYFHNIDHQFLKRPGFRNSSHHIIPIIKTTNSVSSCPLLESFDRFLQEYRAHDYKISTIHNTAAAAG